MLIEGHAPLLRDWSVRLVASDVSAAALAKARAGMYSQMEMNRGLPAPMLVRHFARRGIDWSVSPALRRRIEWRKANLLDGLGDCASADLVLLRNVLIYFEPRARAAVLSRIRDSQAPGSLLVLGSSETALNVLADYRAVRSGRACLYERT
jgi:chemotaxis protein methyltransferase CheR